MKDESLSSRWQSESGKQFAGEIVARLVSGRGLESLELGSHGGLIDLRYLSLPSPEVLQRFEIGDWTAHQLGNLIRFEGVALEGLDLTGARLQSLRFHSARIRDCRFDYANCQDWRLWSSEIANCSFRRSVLRDAAVGTWNSDRKGHGNIWRRIDFGSADFRIGVSCGALYDECDFAKAKLKGVHFDHCAFNRCRFAGKVTEVLFEDRIFDGGPVPQPMKSVDFSEAIFSHVEFRGPDLSQVALPNDPDIRLVPRFGCVARFIVDILKDKDGENEKLLVALSKNYLRGPVVEEAPTVFNRRDYFEFGGAALVSLYEDLLAKAEASCA